MQTKFEDWELTAFALGELSPERSKQIEQMIQDDPAMARELASLVTGSDASRRLCIPM